MPVLVHLPLIRTWLKLSATHMLPPLDEDSPALRSLISIAHCCPTLLKEFPVLHLTMRVGSHHPTHSTYPYMIPTEQWPHWGNSLGKKSVYGARVWRFKGNGRIQLLGKIFVGLNIKQSNITNNRPVLIFPTHLLMVTAGEGYSATWILRHPLHDVHVCAHRFME